VYLNLELGWECSSVERACLAWVKHCVPSAILEEKKNHRTVYQPKYINFIMTNEELKKKLTGLYWIISLYDMILYYIIRYLPTVT
jgi:hypothetical protein